MDTSDSKSVVQDGSQQQTVAMDLPSAATADKRVSGMSTGGDSGIKKKKTRRGKSKRKVTKPYLPWQQRRFSMKNPKINRNRKIVVQSNKTHAPYNNNQFLMEVHMPESAEGVFQIPRAPSARTRDSSFSVDSEENYFYSLPEDEEDFLTKEFSSVYEDAHSERLSNMTKAELMQEYLNLETKVDSLTKRLISRSANTTESDIDTDMSTSEADTSKSLEDMRHKIKEQEDRIRELQSSNEALRLQNERLQQCTSHSTSSSADSESDSSSSTSSSSSQGSFEVRLGYGDQQNLDNIVGTVMVNGYSNTNSPEQLVNGHLESDEMMLTNGTLVNGNGIHENGLSNSPKDTID